MKNVQLLAGTAVVDITPPLEVGLLTSAVRGEYAPFTSVRLPLKARILVLESGERKLAIVSMDLLSLNDTSVGGWDKFKRGLAGELDPENIILTYTHTHCGPESGAVSPLYLTDEFKGWLKNLQFSVRDSIHKACSVLRPCTIEHSCQVLEGYSLQRRVKKDNVVVMSDSLQPIPPELMDQQPIDRRVNIISFRNDNSVVATVVHSICHPVHEMCMTHVSSDFPGEMCRRLEANGAYGMPMFLNGAAGDVNPKIHAERVSRASQTSGYVGIERKKVDDFAIHTFGAGGTDERSRRHTVLVRLLTASRNPGKILSDSTPCPDSTSASRTE